MTDKIVLPFADAPMVMAYHNKAFPLGVLEARAGDKLAPWLCSHLVNCVFSRGIKYELISGGMWGGDIYPLIKRRIELYHEVFDWFGGDILAFLKGLIADGFYINGMWNEEYIPGKATYQKAYKAHDFLLIGYDEAREVFLAVGYLADGRFQRFEVGYDEIRASLLSMTNKKLNLTPIKYNESYVYSLDLAATHSQLEEYLRSYSNGKKNASQHTYGIAAQELLAAVTAQDIEEGRPVDTRYIRTYMEHKAVMEKRMVYLAEAGYLDRPEAVAIAAELAREANRAYMLALKYNMTRRKNDLPNYLWRAGARERAYLPAVLESLSAHLTREEVEG